MLSIFAFFEVKKPLTGSCSKSSLLLLNRDGVFLCVNLEIMSYDYNSTIITMDYGSSVGHTHFKYIPTWEMTVWMVTDSMFTNLKLKF